MAKKKNYFGNGIAPSCSYCQFGTRSKDGKITCEKSGTVEPDSSCKKWIYDPIQRIPKKQLDIPSTPDNDII